jgi:hypothetical protein
MVGGFIILVIVCVLLMAWTVTQGVENQRLRNEVAGLWRSNSDSYRRGYEEGVETVGRLMKDTTAETVGSITKLMMGEVVGERSDPVPQPDSEQAPSPTWFDWEDTDRPPEDFGVGDSVWLDREAPDRVAALGNGEPIIPGVPLPDMTGESFDG